MAATKTYNKSTTYLRAMRETAEASASSQFIYIRRDGLSKDKKKQGKVAATKELVVWL